MQVGIPVGTSMEYVSQCESMGSLLFQAVVNIVGPWQNGIGGGEEEEEG